MVHQRNSSIVTCYLKSRCNHLHIETFLVWFSVVRGVEFDPYIYLLYGIKNIFRYFIWSVQLF